LVVSLMALFPRHGVVPAVVPSGSRPLVEPLSPRELEVFGLIAEHLTYNEIADRLFVSPVTVKRSHVPNQSTGLKTGSPVGLVWMRTELVMRHTAQSRTVSS
jgi:DNA-binding NarL/FixJ family response regulator